MSSTSSSNPGACTHCAKKGCRAWAMGGSIFCAPHNPAITHTGGAPVGNKNAATPGSLYSKYLTADELALVESDQTEGLEGEIRVARVIAARLLGEGDLEAASRALLTVKSLIAEHRKATGDQASGIVAGLQKILDEMGLGGDMPGLN